MAHGFKLDKVTISKKHDSALQYRFMYYDMLKCVVIRRKLYSVAHRALRFNGFTV